MAIKFNTPEGRKIKKHIGEHMRFPKLTSQIEVIKKLNITHNDFYRYFYRVWKEQRNKDE